MRRRQSRSSGRKLEKFLDGTIAVLTKAMIAAFVIGSAMVVTSEFYEPALGKWSVFVAAPYVLIIPVYFIKLLPRCSAYRSVRLPGLDSNQGLQLQRLTCYRYTTGHRCQGRQAPDVGRGGPPSGSVRFPPAGGLGLS